MTQISANWLENAATQSLFRLFAKAGYQLFCVGGCVRNTLLKQPVADIDMATDATPQQVVALADAADLKSIPTGIDHGTVTVLKNEVSFEITTFRTDIETNGRHATVAFSNSPAEDAQRRDFTMNALYVDAAGQVFDTVGGLDDLANRHVRFIGAASERIAEDYLRILRFFRFQAWYGDPAGGIDADGFAACAEAGDGLETLSRERVGAEMRKLLSAPDPAPAIASMAQAGLLRRIMPGADPSVLAVLVHLEDGLHPDWTRRALALGGESIAEIWRLSKAEMRTMAQARDDLDGQTPIRNMAYRHGTDHARNVTYVMAASTQQTVAPDLEAILASARDAVFPVTAKDLIPDYEGAALGQKLQQIEARWISSEFTLSRDELLRA